MWDPDLIFDTSKNYFTEHVGERFLAPTWGGYKDMKEIRYRFHICRKPNVQE